MYSPQTMDIINRALRPTATKPPELEPMWPGQNIGDSCCGNCGQGLCYVDQITGA